MKILYAPWRDEYTGQEEVPEEGCVFCIQLTHNTDEKYFILGRYKTMFIMLNRYPYNGGHILILPLEHIAHLEDLSQESQQELIYLISKSTSILKKELQAPGINVGMNLGKAAGAGIPSHLHAHVLPRWTGDTNFLPTLGNVKQVSRNLETIYHQLRPIFQKILIL